MGYYRLVFEPANIQGDHSLNQIALDLQKEFSTVWKQAKLHEAKSKAVWMEVMWEPNPEVFAGELIKRVKSKVKAGRGVLKYRMPQNGVPEIYLEGPGQTQTVLGRMRRGIDTTTYQAQPGHVQAVQTRLGDDKEFVLDGWSQFVPRFVYRFVTDRDVANINGGNGIKPRNPNATDNMLEHVAGKKETRFVSTTKSKRDIQNPHGESFGERKVKIDLSWIAKERIYDVSTPLGEINLAKLASGKYGELKSFTNQIQQAFRDAKRTKEVLVEGDIPPEAIDERTGF